VVFQVLVVCQANVCRSPSAAALLARRTRATPLAESVAFSSAGVRPEPAGGWCRTARWYVGRRAARMAERHVPRRLDAGLIDSADLLLAMSREERAAIVRLVPTAAQRTFTLVEAAGLADAVLDHLRRPGSAGRSDGPFVLAALPPTASMTHRLEWLVGEMNAARGLVPLSATARFRRNAPLSIDVPDAHGAGRASHRRTFARLTGAVSSFSGAVQQLSEYRYRQSGVQA
jgi:protein-tyrosine phosphatase